MFIIGPFAQGYAILFVNGSTGHVITPLSWVSAALWAIGFVIETVADAQMAFFKQQEGNRGRLIDIGLFRYSRHPNYFGHMLMWWGLAGITGLWWSVFSPVMVTLQLYFQAIPMVEEKYLNREEFQKYKREVCSFVPWFRKESDEEESELVERKQGTNSPRNS